MRIAVVGNFGLTGKQTMAVRALPLAEQLAARGHSVCMALPVRQAADLDGPRESRGVRLKYAGRGPRVPVLKQLWQMLLLAHFAWHWHPDVVYCFKPIAFSGGVLALLWWLRRLGLFSGTLLLDTDDWEGDGGWNERQPFPWWLKRVIALQERWTLRHADLVTVASRALVARAEQMGLQRVLYLPNAPAASSPGLLTPADPDLRRRLGLVDRPLLLLYTRFVEFGLDRLLDTFNEILLRRPDTMLLVVGQGLAGEEDRLRRRAAGRGMEGKILLAGWLSGDQVASYFRAADLAIYPLDDTLLNRTKCPVKLLDLLVAGVPVVADAVGQAVEYLENGKIGVLVPAGDRRAMAEAVVDLLGNPQRRTALGEAARREVLARWRWDLWAEALEKALPPVR
jgi:glycosyltransferase involved in cell wall biosynthesis